jgi:hypothetical protein
VERETARLTFFHTFLSDGTQNSKANAVLVNAHSDSTLPSPGAADDLVGVEILFRSPNLEGQLCKVTGGGEWRGKQPDLPFSIPPPVTLQS